MTDVRLAWLVAQSTLDEVEAETKEARRDALHLLYQAGLQGKKRSQAAEILTEIIRGRPPEQTSERAASSAAYEESLFTQLNDYWEGADPDAPDPDTDELDASLEALERERQA